MALPKFSSLLLLLLLLFLLSSTHNVAEETTFELIPNSMEQWPTTSAIYSYPFAPESDGEDEIDDYGLGDEAKSGRRSLFWRRVHYYISYSALSANRIPCPPRSGRSYYTHNCYRARGPVHPYSRGCSSITRCRR
ncbi:protein RALF-like 19 [Typha angustifolia]|uniref:protein RALF-like 19 n=1 Tax=Typha angustifolia TaxID=59011 RepID=UPI003C30D7F5